MNAVAVNSTFARSVFFYRGTLGKKVVMAVTGIVLFGFLIGHMSGNLQFFLGRDAINGYAEGLRKFPALLWAVRLGLIVAVALHIVVAVQLANLQRIARPVGYVKRKNAGSSYASRTMYWSGPILGLFAVYHLLHLTFGTVHPDFEHLNAYDNLVIGFSKPLVALVYIVAMILLGLHLNHGLWSMFQTLGVSHPRYTPKLKTFARVFSFILVMGFISVPIAILAGYHPDFNRV